MKVYYIKTPNEEIGSLSEYKIKQMYNNKIIYVCDISDFKGKLLSSEYVD